MEVKFSVRHFVNERKVLATVLVFGDHFGECAAREVQTEGFQKTDHSASLT